MAKPFAPEVLDLCSEDLPNLTALAVNLMVAKKGKGYIGKYTKHNDDMPTGSSSLTG